MFFVFSLTSVVLKSPVHLLSKKKDDNKAYWDQTEKKRMAAVLLDMR